ncbi:MAG: hypothetical protein LUG99_13385 [Lachnospiraceae bacterium]|nr:hypothetical protein [Lachnospiraceae bacterium]
MNTRKEATETGRFPARSFMLALTTVVCMAGMSLAGTGIPAKAAEATESGSTAEASETAVSDSNAETSETAVSNSNTETSETAESDSIAEAYTGWKKVDGVKYYYVDGEKVTGWKKISGKYYYFNAKGKLQTNKIVGSKKKGYYYVDKTGVRVTDARIKAAVNFVVTHSKSSQSNRARLKACYVAMYNNPYKRFYGDTPSASTMPSYAAYMFKYNTGNCYRYASAMAYIARVLGYDSRVTTGGVNSSGGTYLAAHGWCEIKVGSTWRILDCSIQLKHKNVSLFLVTRKTYPYPLRWDKSYRMTVKNGKVTWK